MLAAPFLGNIKCCTSIGKHAIIFKRLSHELKTEQITFVTMACDKKQLNLSGNDKNYIQNLKKLKRTKKPQIKGHK